MNRLAVTWQGSYFILSYPNTGQLLSKLSLRGWRTFTKVNPNQIVYLQSSYNCHIHTVYAKAVLQQCETDFSTVLENAAYKLELTT